MFRFSRDKRYFLPVTHAEFTGTAFSLFALVVMRRPDATMQFRTCEDAETYRFSQVTFGSDEVTEILARRPSYTHREFDKAAWKRSYSVSVTIFHNEPMDFMISLSLDRSSDPRRMRFYGQLVDPSLENRIRNHFEKPDKLFTIGDGFPRPSKFNRDYGAQLLSGSHR